MKNKKKKLIITAVVTLAILAGITPFAYKFISEFAAEEKLKKNYHQYIEANTVFFPNSKLNGLDISGKTPSEVVANFENDFLSQSIEIYSERTCTTESFKYPDLNADFSDFEVFVSDVFSKQERSLDEFAERAEEAERVYSYDLLKSVNFDKADFSHVAFFDENKYEKPLNAHISVDLATGRCTVADATNGTLADTEKVVPKLKKAITAGESKLSLDIEDYLTAEIQSDDPSLVSDMTRYNNILNRTIHLGVCGLSEDILPEKIRTFLTYNEEEGLAVNTEKIAAYVDYLKTTYDSYNCLYTFNTSMGTTVNLDYGNYGWTINKETTVEKLSSSLLEDGKDITMSCDYINTCSRPTNALQGNTYFEVSLDYQKVWFYLNGELIVYDDCTTGDINVPESATFRGFFHVSEKRTETYLKGPTWYDFVHYWVRFDDAHANGFHDATWREEWEFGGENRNGNGSHGCVNLRLETAATVYNLITFDMPVIVW